MAQEVLHKIKTHKGKNSLMLMKIDLRKAYDRVEWRFLRKALKGWGFTEDATKLIMSCVNTMQYNILINGNKSGVFNPSRGLRQGDPLSPYLFIMCSEYLSRLILKKKRLGEIHGVKVDKNSPAISHIIYADDLIIMGRTNARKAVEIRECFETYCEWSGQQANPKKSSILFSKNMSSKGKMELQEILGFKPMRRDSVYLGNNFLLGNNKIEEFQRLKKRVQDRLEGWSGQLLSKAGKVTLIKFVVQAIPNYTISTFYIPKKICNDLDAATRKFWWRTNTRSKGMAMKAWSDMCKPKEAGGLGFRQFHDINLVLLSKLAWKIAEGEDTMWTKVLRTKYLKGQSFF